jgi:hypothetical protein
MINVISILAAFLIGIFLSIRFYGRFLDLLTEYSNRSVKNGPWITHLGVGRKNTPLIEKSAIARVGLGGNSSDETIYWNAYEDSDGNLLHSANKYRIFFKSKPLIRYNDRGFWSMTVYGNDKFLVPNPYHKYLIRGNIKTNKIDEKGFSIFLSRTMPGETSTWIPLPLTDERFTVVFRCYVPEKEMSINAESNVMPLIIRL